MTDIVPQTRKSPLGRNLPLIAIALGALVGWWYLGDRISFQTLADNREALIALRDAHYLAAVMGFIALYAVIVAFSLPGATIATLTGGFLFATFPGALFNIAGATLGATAIFLAARSGIGAGMAARLEGSEGLVKRIKDGIDDNQWSMLFLIRLVPVVPFFLANLIPAFLDVPLRRFVISTFLGIMPGAVVFTSVGAGLSEVFARGETPDLGIIFEPQILLPLLGLSALALLPVLLKLVRGRPGWTPPEGALTMSRIKTDICIIGAGSGGLSVAAGAVQMGADVVLIEAHKMGGDCLNYGCVPSKALLAAGHKAHATAQDAFGTQGHASTPDFAAAKDHVQATIDHIAPVDSQERFEGLGVRVIRERARFISDTEVQAGDQIITARRFVIATGSRPFVPPIPGLEATPHHTNETIFDLRERPGHLIIIGGGPIGMEMAQAHRRLGCRVTVLEGQKALGRDDPEAAAIVLDALRRDGIEILEGAQVASTSGTEGAIVVQTVDGRAIEGTHLLVAVGRQVNVDGLDLDKAHVAHDRRGVTVDSGLRSTNKRVYAVGDAAGGLQFTHVAGYHAGVIIRPMLFGVPAKARKDHIPWVTYTDPELAQVGLTEAEARAKHGDRLFVARADFADNDRAIATGQAHGFAKVMVVKGRPVGATIVGPQAGELIQIWALAIANRLKMSAIAGMVAPYPTLGEINKRAAGAYFSPKLFESPMVKKVVRLVQRWL